MTSFDSPWKEALERFLPLFLQFFFPKIHADIDWRRGYDSLDKELEQIVRDAESGNRLADKLFRVWRKNGEEQWVLIHIEIQAQPDAGFPLRMYTYHSRIFDRYQVPVASLAILADESESWQPDSFGYNIWDCELLLRFPTVKLLDYRGHEDELEARMRVPRCSPLWRTLGIWGSLRPWPQHFIPRNLWTKSICFFQNNRTHPIEFSQSITMGI